MRTYASKKERREQNPFGTALSRRIYANRQDYTKRISIPGGGNGKFTFVLGAQLIEMLRPALDEIVNEQKDDTRINTKQANGTMMLARRACMYSDLRNAEALVRRLFALRDGRERTTDLAIADVMCLAANNPQLIQHMHALPRHWKGAQEVAAAWAFARGLRASADELEDLAAETLEVARALWHRPDRQVVCTRQAFEAIGGDRSRWLTTGR